MIRIIGLTVGMLFAFSALAADKPGKAKPAAAAEKAASTAMVSFENKLVDGKKTWLPAEAKVKAGEKISIKITNTLGEPHGFEIPGHLTEVIPANGTKTVALAGIKKGETLEVKCQLHPAHVGAKITGE